MKRTRLIWPDNVVKDKVLSRKLTFLSGVYEKGHLVKAKVFEQMLQTTPETEDEIPVLLGEQNVSLTPILFSMSGGQRWHVKLEQEEEGFKLECSGTKGRLSKVKRVTYTVVHNYAANDEQRLNLKETGESFAFKTCPKLETEYLFTEMFGKKMIHFVPIFMLPKGEVTILEQEEKYPRDSNGKKLRLLGCDVYDKGRFVRFLPAERLPKELVSYLSR